MKDLQDKVAFVTGAASGIGLALTRALLERGMKVVMADMQTDALNRSRASLETGSDRLQAITVDVRDPASMVSAANFIRNTFGRLHLLCNNAGVGGLSPLTEANLTEWRWVLDVNLLGPIIGVQTLLPLIQSHDEGGHIVNTGSMASFMTPPPMVPGGGIYATSKAGLRAYTDALRLALTGSGIGVTGVYPAMVATSLDSTTLANRPTMLSAIQPDQASGLSLLQQTGIPPETVAERIVRGVENDSPTVFTHPEIKPILADHFEHLLSGFDSLQNLPTYKS